MFIWMEGTAGKTLCICCLRMTLNLWNKDRLILYFHCHSQLRSLAGVDNWSRPHTKLVSLCPDFTKDFEACQKKWSAIYNDYKEDKAMNSKSGSQRSEKCQWYTLVDDFMYDRANVVSHAHASAVNPDGPKSDTYASSDINTSEPRSGESTLKSPEPKRKDDMYMERCIGEIRESSRTLMESLKASDDMKMALLMSMQATMQKLVEKL
jgi:hypothetical protein